VKNQLGGWLIKVTLAQLRWPISYWPSVNHVQQLSVLAQVCLTAAILTAPDIED